jgi:hypothetical protein
MEEMWLGPGQSHLSLGLNPLKMACALLRNTSSSSTTPKSGSDPQFTPFPCKTSRTFSMFYALLYPR